jgi:MutS domain V
MREYTENKRVLLKNHIMLHRHTIVLLFLISQLAADTLDIIAQEHLTSFDTLLPDESTISAHLPFSEMMGKEFEKKIHPSAFEKRRALLAIVPHHVGKTILDVTSWQDLNFVCGPRSHRSSYLAAKIDRTRTEFGKIMLLYTITNPTDNREELLNKQLLIKHLLAHDTLYTQLTTLLDELREAENALPTLLDNQQDILKETAQQRMVKIPYFSHIKAVLNKNNILLDVYERLHELQNIGIALSTISATILLPVAGIARFAHHQATTTMLHNFGRDYCGISSTPLLFSSIGIATMLVNRLYQNSWSEGATYFAHGFSYALWSAYTFDDVKSDFFLLYYIQKMLIHLARFISTIKKIHKLIQHNELLATIWPSASLFNDFLYEEPQHNKDLAYFLDLISLKTFTDDASFISHAGTILSAFYLLQLIKPTLSKPLAALGELDVLIATAQLYKEQTSDAPWTFPTYQTNSSPYIDLKDFWNPLITAKNLVTNNATLGITHPRTMIITGPNTGGKSTVIEALAINVSLAQSLGIAPSRAFDMTLCNKIMTYLNITGDRAAGNSHFRAGVLRAHEIIEMVHNLQPQECCMVAIDEIFNGTSHLEGQAAARSFIEYLGSHPQVLLATASHFPLITTLAEQNSALFKNYKVAVHYDDHGNIHYPFKLEPGISHQKITFDVLHQEGFSDTFLLHAQDFLNSTAE